MLQSLPNTSSIHQPKAHGSDTVEASQQPQVTTNHYITDCKMISAIMPGLNEKYLVHSVISDHSREAGFDTVYGNGAGFPRWTPSPRIHSKTYVCRMGEWARHVSMLTILGCY